MELKFIFTALRGEALPCHLMIVQEQSNHQPPLEQEINVLLLFLVCLTSWLKFWNSFNRHGD